MANKPVNVSIQLLPLQVPSTARGKIDRTTTNIPFNAIDKEALTEHLSEYCTAVVKLSGLNIKSIPIKSGEPDASPSA